MSSVLFRVVIAVCVSVVVAGRTNGLQVLLSSECFPGTDPVSVEAIQSALAARGFVVQRVGADALVTKLAEKPASGQLLVLPNAACFPVEARQSLLDYLKAGGNLITIGGPPLSRQVVRLHGNWLTREMLLEKLGTLVPSETLIDFATIDLAKVRREAGIRENPVRLRVVSTDIPEARTALEVSAPNVKLWEFQVIPAVKEFRENDTVTTFWAKGSANARSLIFGWEDASETSWQTKIELDGTWKRYCITADMLKSSRPGKGEIDRRLNLQKIRAFKVGFENDSLRDSDQPVSFCISNICSMPNPAGNVDFAQPTLETLSPSYKTYTTVAAAYVPTRGSYVHLADYGSAMTGPIKTVCSIPRYRGLGFNKSAPHRWIPFLAARMSDGHIGGASAAIYVQDDDIYKGSVWATFGIEDQTFHSTHTSEVAAQIASLAARVDDGLYLLSAGTDRASYFEDTPIVGAVVLNLGKARLSPIEVKCSITDDPAYGGGKESTDGRVLEKSFALTGKRTVAEIGDLKDLAAGFYIATTSLYRDGELIDQIRQPFSVVESKPVDKSELVTIKGDQFYYKDKPWFSLGINYRPIYVAAMEKRPFWDYWTSASQYDAELIDMELDLMQKIGLNTVGLIYPDKSDAVPAAFVDFMERAHRHGLKCHVYIDGVEPFRPAPEKTKKLILAARLWERPAMFAYDTAWEVRIGREQQRRGLDVEWKRWIEDRYGSIENAEQDWDFKLRREGGGDVAGPTDGQVSEDGRWNRMVAAYRRFCDDLLSRRYMDSARVIRSVDPHHPISVRSGFGGTGTSASWALPQLPVDLFSGAKHFQYISPEGYNFRGNAQSFREGGLTTLYAKFVSGGKPVYWAEFGYTVFPATPEKLEAQREYYEKIYRVFHETRSAGSAAWWWPGYLIWEVSDYAIINPDFSLRPAAQEFTRMSMLVNKPVPSKAPDYWIDIDRDLYATGYAGVLAEKRQEYGKAVAEGKTVGLRTRGTGTDSSNFPRIAIGNTPLNGRNAPKYLNAEFNTLEMRDADGKWIAVEDGGKITVKTGFDVYIRASLGNIAESTWLAPKGDCPGVVQLKAVIGDSSVLSSISADTPFLSDAQVPAFKLADNIAAPTRASFQLVVDGIVFGEKRYITLVNAP